MIDHLRQLEAEAIYILRETAAQFERPALLFSGGKDSICLVHLSLKAFRPGAFPYPLVHVDTGHNFPETIEYRDRMTAQIGEKLIVRNVQDSINRGTAVEEKGRFASRNMLQTVTLLETIEEFKFDACIGGARRDEEKARAKERIFSVRDSFGQWDPRLQRPELWNLYNGKIQPERTCESFRSATGLSSTYGTTSWQRRSPFLRSTSRTNARSLNGTGCCFPCLTSFSLSQRKSRSLMFDSARSET